MKKEKRKIQEMFRLFEKSRVREYLGEDYKIIQKIKGAALATKEQSGFAACIGDAKGVCSPRNGEGIRQAILSAVEYVSKLS